ncbi:MAG TPA: hypothetical protein VK543_05755 [Puia sp.]|nr:hypothetical protein [Puia sp.]
MEQLPLSTINSIYADLFELDNHALDIHGEQLKASQCYHFGSNPPHLLFNTNCPQDLKQKVTAIIKKYIPDYESGSQK